MKKRKLNIPIDVFESEIAQAQLIVDEQTRKDLSIINQDRLAQDANAVTVKPEVNRKKMKVSNLFRLYIGDKPIGYCGNLLQIVRMIREAAQDAAIRKSVEKKRRDEEAKQAEAQKREAGEKNGE